MNNTNRTSNTVDIARATFVCQCAYQDKLESRPL